MPESDYKRKKDIPRIFTVISTIVSLCGGSLSMFSYWQIQSAENGLSLNLYLVVPLFFGSIIIIGALIGLLWYQRGGPILCLSIGLLSLVACQGFTMTEIIPCISFSPIYLSGSILTITGSIIGLIGGILKKKESKKDSIDLKQ